jgi:hypothetical protein
MFMKFNTKQGLKLISWIPKFKKKTMRITIIDLFEIHSHDQQQITIVWLIPFMNSFSWLHQSFIHIIICIYVIIFIYVACFIMVIQMVICFQCHECLMCCQFHLYGQAISISFRIIHVVYFINGVPHTCKIVTRIEGHGTHIITW